MNLILTKADAKIIAQSIANATTRPTAGENHHLAISNCLKPGIAGCSGTVATNQIGQPPMSAYVLVIDFEPVYYWKHRSTAAKDVWYARTNAKAIQFEALRGQCPEFNGQTFPTVKDLITAAFGGIK
jgi:hypothetical protein